MNHSKIKAMIWLLGILLVSPPAWAGSGAIATNAVAVADFQTLGAAPTNRDWAFGLADVLAVDLQQRGVTLFERQQIRVVLGERQISASGLMQLHGSPVQNIPALSYLVTGNIRGLKNGRFHIEASLVAAQTGRNVASFAREGRYPKDVPAALGALADEIVSHLKAAGNSVLVHPPLKASPGATPEINLLFYKGVSCCLAGKPELGVTWFIDLQKIAPDFLPAQVWTMRAFQMLGLTNFVAIARERLRKTPNGQGVLNCLDQSHFLNRQLVTVAVLADPKMDAAGWRFQAALKTALSRCNGLFVADPANIRSLAAEMDLQLTENGSRGLELDSILWSAVDVLALIRPTEHSGTKSYSVELRDALTGELLFRGQAPASLSRLDEFCRELAGHIRAKGKSFGPGELSNQAHPRAQKPPQVSNTDRDEFAALLRYVSENPSDRSAWMRLALFFPWLDAHYACACFDHVLAATDLHDPDAAHWISEAIWHKRSYEGTSRGFGTTPSIAVEAAPLFQHFPNSPEAQYARSALALEYIDQKNYAKAVPILLKLAKELPQLADKVDIKPDYWANFYFFTAAALHETGDDTQARQFLAKAAKVLKQNPNMVIYDGNTFQLGVWVNHFPVEHPLFGKERNLRDAVAEWQKRLNPPSTNTGQATVTLNQLETLLTDARHSYGAEADARYFEFLRELVKHERQHPRQYRGRITDTDSREPWRQIRLYHATTAGNYTLIGKFIIEAPGILQQLAEGGSTNRLAEVRQLGHELAKPLDPEIAANFYEATAEYALALQKVEEAMHHPAPYPHAPSEALHVAVMKIQDPINLRRQKIRLLQELGKKAEAAAYARSQIPAHDVKPHWQPMPAGPGHGSYSFLTDPNIKLDACRDAADAYAAIGRLDVACSIFARFARETGPDDQMDAHGATVRLYWADYETARENYFQAAEILRAVAHQSEGKHWGVQLRTGYADAYKAAVSRLAKIRTLAQLPFTVSTDWEHPSPMAGNASVVTNALTTEMQRDLADILRGKSTGPNQTSYGYGVNDFINKYGSNAVPVVLRAAERNDFQAHLIAQFRLLDRIATLADAPSVLEAFRHSPRLAQTAFRLDATKATAILADRLGIYAKGGRIPPELINVIRKYRLREEYPVLIANLSAKPLDGNLARDAATVDRVLRHGATPEQMASFRSVLASLLEKQLLSSYRYGLASLAETALRNGVPEGIEARLRCDNPVSTNSLVCLRKYLNLPVDDAQALAAVQAGLGRWQWNPKTKKFVLGDKNNLPSASTQNRKEILN